MKLARVLLQNCSLFLFKLNFEIIVHSRAYVKNTTEGHPVSMVTLCITIVHCHSQEIGMDTIHQQTAPGLPAFICILVFAVSSPG